MSCFGFEQDEVGLERQFDWKFERVYSHVIVTIPCLLLITMNTMLLFYAVRVTKTRIKHKNVAVVILVTLTFILT